MGNVASMAVKEIKTVIPLGVTVDWRKYQRARKAYLDAHPADEGYRQLKREYELEAQNMANWMDVIMEEAEG